MVFVAVACLQWALEWVLPGNRVPAWVSTGLVGLLLFIIYYYFRSRF
jgi:hypothetical protein